MTSGCDHRKHWLVNINIFSNLKPFRQLTILLLVLFFPLLILMLLVVDRLIFIFLLIKFTHLQFNNYILQECLNISFFLICINSFQEPKSKEMFDELINTCSQSVNEVKIIQAQTKKQLLQFKQEFGLQEDNFHDPTKVLGKAVSFSKSGRFKQLEKEDYKTTDFTPVESMQIFKQPKGVPFSKSERFIPEKEDEMTIITPNFDPIKRNNKQAPKIAGLSDKQMSKSRLSQATMASEAEVGPGKYFVNENQTTVKKTPAFSKSKRFEKQKQKYEDIPLFVKQTQTMKRPPTMAVLKKKIEKNKKQISISQQQQLRQRLKLVYWNSIPLELDRLLKKNSQTPILKDNYFNLKKMGPTQRRCALLMLINRLDYERGGFTYNINSSIGNQPCAAVYRKSTPKPFIFPDNQPGPDYYYPFDDLTKPGLIGFSFGKQQQKPAKPDNRDYNVNQQYLKLGGDILIMPQHKHHSLTQEQIKSLNRGPGFYDCLFSQVEKRNDIGIVKFQEITQKNARENNCVEVKEVNDGVYFPSYEAVDPHIPGPVIKNPVDVRAAHLPDKEIFPEHWVFYDGDLNKVRAEIAKNVLIGGGLPFEQYQKYTKKLEGFKNYMDLRRKQAEKLEYNPKFDVIDPHVQGFDMQKQQQKNMLDAIRKQEFQLDGDNLILEPERLKPHLPHISFGKMVGRQQKQYGPDDDIEGDVLILQPKKQQKHLPQIDFNKMIARPQLKNDQNEDEQPAQGDRIILNPVLPPKKLPNIDFSKQVQRNNKVQIEAEDRQELIIQPEKNKRIKGFVEMQRMSSVRLVPYLRNKKQSKSRQKASVISRRNPMERREEK